MPFDSTLATQVAKAKITDTTEAWLATSFAEVCRYLSVDENRHSYPANVAKLLTPTGLGELAQDYIGGFRSSVLPPEPQTKPDPALAIV